MQLMRGSVALIAPLLLSLVAATSLEAGTRFPDVTAEQARELIQARGGKAEFVVLDVRTPQEFAEGHLAGALNLNALAPDFESRLRALDRGKTYLVYCRTGNRSAKAIQTMERPGFRAVYHMFEGIVGWQKKGLPLSRAS
jgi:rhodanese-related sulfurtransferase